MATNNLKGTSHARLLSSNGMQEREQQSIVHRPQSLSEDSSKNTFYWSKYYSENNPVRPRQIEKP